jgi:hypothetical protein
MQILYISCIVYFLPKTYNGEKTASSIDVAGKSGGYVHGEN